MSWPLAFLLVAGLFSLLFFGTCIFVYLKEYAREEQILKNMEQDQSKMPIIYFKDIYDSNEEIPKQTKKEKIISDTILPSSPNRSKKNIN